MAGFGDAQVLEVLLDVDLKTFTNHANPVVDPEAAQQSAEFSLKAMATEVTA